MPSASAGGLASSAFAQPGKRARGSPSDLVTTSGGEDDSQADLSIIAGEEHEEEDEEEHMQPPELSHGGIFAMSERGCCSGGFGRDHVRRGRGRRGG